MRMFAHNRKSHTSVSPLLALVPLILVMAMVTPAFQNGQWQFNLIAGANAEPAKSEEIVKAVAPTLLPKDEQPPLYRLLRDPRVILEGDQRRDVEDGALDSKLADLMLAMLSDLRPKGLQSIQIASIKTGHCIHVDCDDSKSISDHSDGHAIDLYGLNGVMNVNIDHPLVCTAANWLYAHRSQFGRLQVISPCAVARDGNTFFQDLDHHYDHIHIGGR